MPPTATPSPSEEPIVATAATNVPADQIVGVDINDLPPPPAGKYDFVVPSFTITTMRSGFLGEKVESDTDYASLAIVAMAADGTTLQTYGPITQSLGNLGNGSHGLGMALRGIDIPDGGTMGIVFTIANKGSSSAIDTIVSNLNTVCAGIIGALASGQLAGVATAGTPAVAATATTAAAAAVPPAAVAIPLWEAALGVALAAAVLDLITVLFADCDGWVVNATMQIGSLELEQMASQAPWEWTTTYPGSNSPTGCGANSNYVVEYQVYASSLEVTVPNVLGLSPTEAAATLTAARLTVETTYIVTHTTEDPLPESRVINQSPPAGTSVAVGSVEQIEVNVPEREPGHPLQ